MNALERNARMAFFAWAAYRKWTRCWDCSFFEHCGAAHASGPFVCVACFDQRSRR